MRLEQIEAFIWIARLGSFVAAAERLNITQPTVSQRIRELETDLGGSLFDRSGRRARLTDQGRELLPLAEEMLLLRQRIQHQIGHPAHLTGTVRVGVAELVALTWLPQLIDQVGRLHPGVTLELDIDLTEILWAKFDQGLLDVALIPKLRERPELETHWLGAVPFSWMASPNLDIPDRELAPADLVQWPILLLSQHSNLHEVIQRWFSDSGAKIRRQALSNNLTSIAILTMRGLGISTLPVDFYQAEIAQNRLRCIKTSPPLPPVAYWAVHRPREAERLAAIVAALAVDCTSFT